MEIGISINTFCYSQILERPLDMDQKRILCIWRKRANQNCYLKVPNVHSVFIEEYPISTSTRHIAAKQSF